MKSYIVTESDLGETLISKLLHGVVPRGEFAVTHGGGLSSAISLARSLLSARPSPVALVVNARTTDTSLIQEQQLMLDDELKDVALSSRFRVILAIPQIEICLF